MSSHLGTGCPGRRIPVGSPGGSGLRAGWMGGGRKCSCLQTVQCSASRRDDTLERTQELLHNLMQKTPPHPLTTTTTTGILSDTTLTVSQYFLNNSENFIKKNK